MADHPQDPVSPMHGSSSTVRGGHIQLVLGPMFSGKSSELMRRCRRHLHASKAVLLIKFAGDTRYSNDKMSSHDKVRRTLRLYCFQLIIVWHLLRRLDVQLLQS